MDITIIVSVTVDDPTNNDRATTVNKFVDAIANAVNRKLEHNDRAHVSTPDGLVSVGVDGN